MLHHIPYNSTENTIATIRSPCTILYLEPLPTNHFHTTNINMPRQGEGHIAHNAVDPNVNQVAHGAGEATPNEVAGAKKAAPMPEQTKGAGLEGLPASGGSSQGLKQGPDVGQGGARS